MVTTRLRIERTCEGCGTTYLARTDTTGRFCSRACSDQQFRRPLIERFWSHVNKSGPIPPHRPELGPCWIWTAKVHRLGYGQLEIGSRTDGTRRTTSPHILALEWQLGRSLAEGCWALHRCDNRACVRNDGESSHLFEGTRDDNFGDMVAKGRAWWQQDRPPDPRLQAVLSTLSRERWRTSEEIGQLAGVSHRVVRNLLQPLRGTQIEARFRRGYRLVGAVVALWLFGGLP